MVFKIIDKNNVMEQLENEDLYLLKVSKRGQNKYCSSKQASSLSVREVMKAMKDNNVAFIKITEES